MNFITWLFVGSISGWLAAFALRIDKHTDLKINIFAGLVGAFASGIYITRLFGIETINQKTFSFPSMLVSLGGAVILILAVYFFRRMRTRTTLS